MQLLRRQFLLRASVLIAGVWLKPQLRSAQNPFFKTRGVVLVPNDFSLTDWPRRAHASGLNTIGIHGTSVEPVLRFVASDAGKRMLAECAQLGLRVEYELHAMQYLLPRSLFATQPQLFRMNEKGERTPDANLCVHSQDAIQIVIENAVKASRQLRPTTNRFFYWFDDGQPGCRCSKRRELSDSDQALLVENEIAKALRAEFTGATLAHLAYDKTMSAPRHIKPAPGIFLEFAPIHRSYDKPFAEQTDGPDTLLKLDDNLRVFGADTAQVLEYWIDVSRFSQWRRPAVKCPWRADVMAADLKTYARRGVRHLTSFGVFIDAEYLRLHGEPDFILEYGKLLNTVAA